MLEKCTFAETHRGKGLRPGAECPVQNRSELPPVLCYRDRQPVFRGSVGVAKPGPLFNRNTGQQGGKRRVENRPQRQGMVRAKLFRLLRMAGLAGLRARVLLSGQQAGNDHPNYGTPREHASKHVIILTACG